VDTIALSSSAVTTAVTSTIQQQRHHHRHGQGHAAHLGRIPVPSRVTKHRVAGAAPRALRTAGLPRPFVQVTTRQACARSSAATPTWERKYVLPLLANAIWPYATAAEWTPAGAGTKGGPSGIMAREHSPQVATRRALSAEGITVRRTVVTWRAMPLTHAEVTRRVS
jgi:hypothetical protein